MLSINSPGAGFSVAVLNTMGVGALHHFIQRYDLKFTSYTFLNERRGNASNNFLITFLQNYTNKKSNVFGALIIYRHILFISNLSNNIQQKWTIPTPLAADTVGAGKTLAVLVQTPMSSEILPIILITMIM